MSAYLRRYPFSERLYPGALDVIKHLGNWGPTVIMSDGDPTFQPYKIQESGLSKAVDGRVLTCIQKEKMLAQLQQRYPAHQYVMVDDNLRVLAAMKWGMVGRLTTVFSRQGQYAIDPHMMTSYPSADLSVDRIANLLDYDLPTLLRSSQHAVEKPQVELSLM
ncbi:MAG: HAD family hydrolase [Cytophaga sp.]|nr:HAD family hydrolase [Undibacterium sp.]